MELVPKKRLKVSFVGLDVYHLVGLLCASLSLSYVCVYQSGNLYALTHVIYDSLRSCAWVSYKPKWCFVGVACYTTHTFCRLMFSEESTIVYLYGINTGNVIVSVMFCYYLRGLMIFRGWINECWWLGCSHRYDFIRLVCVYSGHDWNTVVHTSTGISLSLSHCNCCSSSSI